MAFTVDTATTEIGSLGVCRFSAHSSTQEDLTNQLILDISTLRDNPPQVEILSVSIAVQSCVAKLFFDRTTDEFIISAISGHLISVDFKKIVGVSLRGVNTGGTGDLLLSTANGDNALIAGVIIFQKVR